MFDLTKYYIPEETIVTEGVNTDVKNIYKENIKLIKILIKRGESLAKEKNYAEAKNMYQSALSKTNELKENIKNLTPSVGSAVLSYMVQGLLVGTASFILAIPAGISLGTIMNKTNEASRNGTLNSETSNKYQKAISRQTKYVNTASRAINTASTAVSLKVVWDAIKKLSDQGTLNANDFNVIINWFNTKLDVISANLNRRIAYCNKNMNSQVID